MSNESEQNELLQNELLLTAYLDGELSPSEVRTAEQLLQQPEYAELLNAWKQNREQLKSLPKFRLKDSFTAEVLDAAKINAAIESGQTEPLDVSVQNVSVQNPVNWNAGMAAIISLAGMVLLSLFVFPQWVAEPVASVNDPAEASEKVVDQVVDKNDESNSNAEVEAGNRNDSPKVADTAYQDRNEIGVLFSRSARTVAEKVDSNQILSWVNNPGAHLNSPSHGPLGIFQIEMTKESFVDLEKVLQTNKIVLRKSEETEQTKTADQLLSRFNSNLKVLYVVATPLQMKKAMVGLKVEYDAKIETLRIPEGVKPIVETADVSQSNDDKGNGISRPSRIVATAQQLMPFERDASENMGQGSNPEEVEEIDQLDQWFGLTGKENAQASQYLLLIDVGS